MKILIETLCVMFCMIMSVLAAFGIWKTNRFGNVFYWIMAAIILCLIYNIKK